ncbi:MAG TPA: RIP metalloprotease RseP [Burkholderiales bacterium]|nr:RIP metalloprotease RseP [Burkholderiales bacterium]
MSFLHTVVAFVVALGVLIVVHEYGHYLAARLCNVRVLRFSVGFGRPIALLRRGKDRTEWVLAAIPFGGYVKMLDEREGPVPAEEVRRAFNRQSVGRRFFIVAAGPAFNFLFAILLYAGLYMAGMPEARPVLAEPPAGTVAAQAGLKAGDTVRSVEGEAVTTWQEVRWRVLQAALEQERITLEAARDDGAARVVTLDFRGFSTDEVERDVLARAGLGLFRPPLAPVLGAVVSGSPAEAAGLAAGDRIVRANGKPIGTWEALVEAVRGSPGTPLALTVERGETTLPIEVVPEAVPAGEAVIGRIGAAPRITAADREAMTVHVRHGPLASLGMAVAKTWDISVFSLRMLGRMVFGQVSWKHLSGPVTIADFAGQSAQLGWISYLTFLALISISLGVLNLLPIPLLDGGHLMYYGIELIKGKPVSERAMELGQRVGLALLLVLMAFAFYNDFNRLLTG